MPEGLYWKLEYLAERDEWWQIDMWVLDEGVAGPRVGEHVTESLRARLTDESRELILGIKEEAVSRGLRIPGYQVCRAVLDHGSETLDEFLGWYDRASSGK